METTNEKTKLEEAGAFWIKKSKTGNNFLTGTVKNKSGEEIKVIVFKNKYKTEGSNQPDYRVYFDTSTPPAVKTNQATEKSKSAPSKNKEELPQTDEIPF
jgi:uncharacterized protein (DUF736 family)